MSFSSIVTTTSFSTLQPSSSATKDAVSKSIIWERDAITPFFIRHLTTSAPVFFMREASSPTEISSGILTVSGVFFAISSCRRRIFSASSCLRLPENGCWRLLRFLLLRNFSLLPRSKSRRSPERSAMSCSFSSYLSRLTFVTLRVSTIFFSGTRVVGCCVAVDLLCCCTGWVFCCGWAGLPCWPCWGWGRLPPLLPLLFLGWF